MYDIQYSRLAEKFLDKCEQTDRIRIIKSLERIRIRPHSFTQKLVGRPEFKFRIGAFRCILDIADTELRILIIEIGHRKNIYK